MAATRCQQQRWHDGFDRDITHHNQRKNNKPWQTKNAKIERQAEDKQSPEADGEWWQSVGVYVSIE